MLKLKPRSLTWVLGIGTNARLTLIWGSWFLVIALYEKSIKDLMLLCEFKNIYLLKRCSNLLTLVSHVQSGCTCKHTNYESNSFTSPLCVLSGQEYTGRRRWQVINCSFFLPIYLYNQFNSQCATFTHQHVAHKHITAKHLLCQSLEKEKMVSLCGLSL